MRTCTIEGCTKAHRAKGLCGTHYNRANYSSEQLHPKVKVPCAVCGIVVEKYRQSRYRPVCSDACKYVLTFGRRKPRCDVIGPMPATCALPPREMQESSPTARFVGVTCGWCSDPFIQDLRVTGAAIRYCSATCAKRAGKVRERVARGRFDIDRVTRLAIYERDLWTCQLCDEPVDPDLPPSHRWAATLDHIEPQSWALIPDHSPANLRLAHRMCNSTRGAGAYHEAG